MKKSFAPGEIYFVKEVDSSSKSGRSKWVKIGKVANDRESLERLGEHQTGNPRKLTLEPAELVKTELVSVVEAKLHREFAHLRVRGEWFELPTDVELKNAIATAERFAAEAADAVKVFVKAAELTKTAATADALDPTDELRALAVRCEIARVEVSRIKKLRDDITSKFASAAAAGVDVEDVFTQKAVVKKPKFKADLLKGADPGLYEIYASVSITTRIDPTFLLKVKLIEGESLESLFPEYAEEMQQISDVIASTLDPNAALGLADAEASLLRWGGYWEWELSLSKATLQVAVGDAKAITGLCTWPRPETNKTVESFDETTFLLDYPEEYSKYVEVPAGYTRRKVTPRKK